jgi:predicted nuclease of restriction endonuclease-like (RecB) superfamily
VLIFQKISDVQKATWYVQKTLENNWSRNVLGIQIENRLYERQAEKPRIDNFAERLPAPNSDLARETLTHLLQCFQNSFAISLCYERLR